MTNKELKPCPFCGGEAKIVQNTLISIPAVWIECTGCEVSTRMVQTSLDYCAKDMAAKIWNERVDK